MKLGGNSIYWILLAVVLSSCSGRIGDKVIVEDLIVLEDGGQRIFKLDPGTYKLELTSSGDGASVQWVGASCPTTDETTSLTTVCKYSQIGQVIVSNPTSLGLGQPISITLKLTRLARDI